MYTHPLHIFLVDDDEDDRFFFEKALKDTGIPAMLSQVGNGLELLVHLESTTELPSLIFLDINMPVMDGLTALGRIKANEAFRKVPIIIFSTSDNPITVRNAYELGAQLYLRKPDRYDDYIFLLETILSGTGEPESFVRRSF